MPEDTLRPAQAAIRTDLGAIFVSMGLSRRPWLIKIQRLDRNYTTHDARELDAV
jgi:hypothetical protein